jgi:hypothetical protein
MTDARDASQQGCSGNTAKGWGVYPLCEACGVRGFVAESVRQTKVQSKRCGGAKKRARPALAPQAGYKFKARETDSA